MAKFVIAGKADCPYYAKAEILADYLAKNLPDFQIFKITQHPDVWEEWLEELCERNGWDHRTSPIIWRELLDRGGEGLLLGGYNEFLEHAQLYYGVTSSMTTELMMLIAEENLETHIEKELEKESMNDLINPLEVWIVSASTNVCNHLIPILVSGDVFGVDTEISLTFFDWEQTENCLISVVMETQDLASPILRSVSYCTNIEEAFFQAQVIIFLDESTDEEVFSLEGFLRSRVPLCRLYGYMMEKNADKSVKVIVGGKTFVNLKTALLMQYAPNIASNIIAVALGVEGQAKAILARKMKTSPSSIKDVIIWGNITGNNYVDLRKAKVYNYESAIWGPPGYYHSVLNLIFDSEWVTKEFGVTLETLSTTGREFGCILAAHSITTTMKYWNYGSPPGEIVSLGVMSEGQFGIPEGIVFSMPVKFENGTWEVLTNLEDISLSEKTIKRLADDLIQEKLIAMGDLLTFLPVVEESKTSILDAEKAQSSMALYGEKEQDGWEEESYTNYQLPSGKTTSDSEGKR
ncbi:putative malate dehydrogenase 1B isoform X1 [Meriones unguiculatus]|uniref:putative malate dehydrogenase 1B isoform X1 n=1 Tax=Meriones unguiculatus TaxID=10047 RepID=UPI00293E70D8|nr:putative malate dehydrogenase 1B isoform X1 [Meriones unguiculatus]